MKKVLITVIIALVVIAAISTVLVTSFDNKKANDEIEKTILVVVDYGNGTSDEYTINTKAKNLKDALDEKKLIKGEQGSYGLYITSVNSVEADTKLKQWWKITKNGEMVQTGISSIKIADGEKYELTLTTGYNE